MTWILLFLIPPKLFLTNFTFYYYYLLLPFFRLIPMYRHPLVLFDQASTDFLLYGDTPETRQRLLSSLFWVHTGYHQLIANGDSSASTLFYNDKVEKSLDSLFAHFNITSIHFS